MSDSPFQIPKRARDELARRGWRPGDPPPGPPSIQAPLIDTPSPPPPPLEPLFRRPDELRASQRAVLELYRARGPLDDEEALRLYRAAEAGDVEELHGLLPLPSLSRAGLLSRRRELAARGLLGPRGDGWGTPP